MLTERSFDTGSLIINYAEGFPNGAPFAVLHGIPSRWQGMTRLITPLENEWHVFACDMRGHGKSGRAATYRAIDYFPDTAAFITHRIAPQPCCWGTRVERLQLLAPRRRSLN